MALKTTRWNSARHLRSEADRAAYLEACIDEASDDPAFVAMAQWIVAHSRGQEPRRDVTQEG
jgi:DNA-binding phage protein